MHGDEEVAEWRGSEGALEATLEYSRVGCLLLGGKSLPVDSENGELDGEVLFSGSERPHELVVDVLAGVVIDVRHEGLDGLYGLGFGGFRRSADTPHDQTRAKSGVNVHNVATGCCLFARCE